MVHSNNKSLDLCSGVASGFSGCVLNESSVLVWAMLMSPHSRRRDVNSPSHNAVSWPRTSILRLPQHVWERCVAYCVWNVLELGEVGKQGKERKQNGISAQVQRDCIKLVRSACRSLESCGELPGTWRCL